MFHDRSRFSNATPMLVQRPLLSLPSPYSTTSSSLILFFVFIGLAPSVSRCLLRLVRKNASDRAPAGYGHAFPEGSPRFAGKPGKQRGRTPKGPPKVRRRAVRAL